MPTRSTLNGVGPTTVTQKFQLVERFRISLSK